MSPEVIIGLILVAAVAAIAFAGIKIVASIGSQPIKEGYKRKGLKVVCKHETLSKPDKRGYQYCQTCNKAFPIQPPVRFTGHAPTGCSSSPPPPPPKKNGETSGCKHRWVAISNITTTDKTTGNSRITGKLLQCSLCGDMKNHYI